MEVIRRVPNLPEPYRTLGLIHEEQGNVEQAMNFLIIAARMTPKVSLAF